MDEPGAGGRLWALAGPSSRGEEVEGQGTERWAAADEPGAGGGLRTLAGPGRRGATDEGKGEAVADCRREDSKEEEASDSSLGPIEMGQVRAREQAACAFG